MEENLKQLLLKDLCARLPYKVVIEYNNDGCSSTRELGLGSLHDFMCDNAECKPYLRPFSDATTEEINTSDRLFMESKPVEAMDYLLSRHIDIHGLLPMGLAIEAPKDMYNVK